MTGLRVGLDVSPLALTRAGAARYIESLLARSRRTRSRFGATSFGGSAGLSSPVRDVGWYLAALPLRARLDGVDVLHCPTHRAPVRRRVPLVVTLHDIAVLRHPELFNRWTRPLQPRRAAAGRAGGAARDRGLGVHAAASCSSCSTCPTRRSA